MIRRAAIRIPDSAPGFVIEGLVKTDSDQNQTYVLVFEASGPGLISEESIANIHLVDGSPLVVPLI